MAEKIHANHGRDHAPNGADPIPNLREVYPPLVQLVDPRVASFLGYKGFSGNYTASVRVALGTGSSEAPEGWYIDSSAADNDVELVMFAHLGPKGSLWQPMFDYLTGPDCGKFKIGLSAISEDGTDTGFDQTGLVGESKTTVIYDSDPLFFPGDVSGSLGWGWNFDAYDPSGGWAEGVLGNAIRIMGDHGTYPTTSGTIATDPFDCMELDSGPGLYEFRIVSDGKNASSSNYRKRFGSITFLRVSGWDQAPVS